MASYSVFLKHQQLLLFLKNDAFRSWKHAQFGDVQQVWEGPLSRTVMVSPFFSFILKGRWVLLSICCMLSPHKHFLDVEHPPTVEINVNLMWLSHPSTVPSTRNVNVHKTYGHQ